MTTNPAIDVQSLSKSYRVYRKPLDRLRELLLPSGHAPLHTTVHALRDVFFRINKGDRLGILGVNGSGKSTLLRIVAGVLEPTSGQVTVNGRVAALLELGSSFNPELTGRENVMQYGSIMGFTPEEMPERFARIHEFSELGDFVDSPVKTYSSGMAVRLAFSASVFVEPDILIVDEALAVGDAYFQSKCFYKIKSLIDQGCTFMYVTHSPDSVRSLCNQAILLEHGRIICEGDGDRVGTFYTSHIYERQVAQAWYRPPAAPGEPVPSGAPADDNSADDRAFTKSEAFAARVADLRQGSGEARIQDVVLLGEDGEPTGTARPGEKLTIRVCVETIASPGAPVGSGVGIKDQNGIQILQFESAEASPSPDLSVPGRHILEFTFENCLADGNYSIDAGLVLHGNRPDIPGQLHAVHVIDACFGGVVFTCLPHATRSAWGRVRIPVSLTHRRI
jgi:lipopolysaccharide transport system ATP-binding protein